MALKIVTGGTTGAADGTLVSSGNPLVIVALNTAVDAHIRCDDGYWSNDQDFDVPAELEVSFDGGSTWYDNADEPITAPEIYAVNVPIKIRQTVAAGSTSGSFVTDGTYTAITALADVTGFGVTPGNAQNALAWSAVTNRTRYQVDRATDSGFTTGVVLGIYTGTGLSVTDTGLTNGTTYYYRIKAIGTGRYSDSANWATGNGAPTSAITFNDTFTGSAGVLTSHTSDTSHAWQAVSGNQSPKLDGSGQCGYDSAAGGSICAALVTTAAGDDIILECGMGLDSGSVGDQVGFLARSNDAVSGSGNFLHPYLYHDTDGVKLGMYNGGSTSFFTLVSTILGSYSAGTIYTVRLELSGTSAVVKISGTTAWSGTVTTNITGGKIGVRLAGHASEHINFLRTA